MTQRISSPIPRKAAHPNRLNRNPVPTFLPLLALLLATHGFATSPTDPRFVLQPSDSTILAGETGALSGLAEGTLPIHYQWRFGDQLVPGATNETLFFFNATTDQAGPYRLVASNTVGVITSEVAVLTVRVIAPDYFSEPPLSQGAVAGETVQFRGSAHGHPYPAIHWQFNGQPIPEATGDFLTLHKVTAEQAGDYTAVAVNEGGTLVSQPAHLEVVPRGPLDNWIWRRPTPQGDDLDAIAFGNGALVAVGRSGARVVSLDSGVTWQNLPVHPGDLDAIAFGNNRFVGLGGSGASIPEVVETSTDGLTWMQHDAPELNGFQAMDLAYGQGKFVGVGWNVTSVVSADGATWDVAPYEGELFTRVTFGNNRFVALSSFSVLTETGRVARLAESEDGLTWTPRPLNVAGVIADVTWGNGLYAACGNLDGPLQSAAAVFTSPDLISWTTHPLPFPNTLFRIIYENGQFMAISQGLDWRLVTSADGAAWTIQELPFTEGLHDFTATPDALVAVGNFGAILTSNDGEEWVVRSGASGTNFRGIAHGQGLYVATGNDGFLFTSPDGVNWTARSHPGSEHLRSAGYGNGRFVVVGNDDDDGATILVSSDGLEWTRVRSRIGSGLFDVVWADGRFVAIGEDGIAAVSTDGTTWAAQSTPTVERLNAITWGDGQYVAVGRRAAVVSSVDGTNWVLRLRSEDSEFLQAVAFGNGVFVAAGHNGFTMSATTNLIFSWQPSPFRNDVEDLVFANGYFLGVGENGYVATTVDGQAWTPRPTRVDNTLRAVTYADNRFTVVGNNETILQTGFAGPPRLIVDAGPDEDGFVVGIDGPAGLVFRLQACRTFGAWIDLGTFTNGETRMWLLDDSAPLDDHRFYRIVSP